MTQQLSVLNALELMPFFYQAWALQSPDGDMLNCTEGEFELRETFEKMFRVLGRQICKDHGMEEAFGTDPERTSTIPKESNLSYRAQQIYEAICLFVGFDPRKPTSEVSLN